MEPFELSNREFEYRVIPSNPNPLGHEIYSIDRVTLTNDTEDFPVHEFFSLNHAHQSEHQFFWKGTRRPATNNLDVPDKGTEIYVNFVDLRDHAVDSNDFSVDIEATCLNRDLPGRLPFGGGEPRLKILGTKVSMEPVVCLTPLSPTLRPATTQETLWRLISHLSVGQFSMLENLPGAEAIREVLTLYDLKDTPETRELINSLQSVESRQVVGRLPDDTHGVVRGTEIILQFAPENFSHKWLYLMSVMLERFFSIHCTINSFIRVKIRLRGDEELMELGPGRAGDRVFI
jgi:type VI secretion system protein ImpG